jgi:hypothetical protein
VAPQSSSRSPNRRTSQAEARPVRQLEEENAWLKRLVGDLTLDKHMLAEALRRKS